MVHKFFQKTERDTAFYKRFLESRMPDRMIDAHVHLALPKHTRAIDPKLLEADWALQCAHTMSEEQLAGYSASLFPDIRYEYIALPMPIKGVDLEANNSYISSIRMRALMATLPQWDTDVCEKALITGGFSGFKPYPNLVSTVKGAEISILDFITHSQLSLLNKHKKALLLHLPRAGRLPDEDNIRELRDMRQAYPNIKIVVAHFGRCFNVEPFLEGIKKLGSDLEGFYFDTSAVINPQVYAAAFDHISPDSILFGSDLPITLWHGKRTWNNGSYQNLCREDFKWNKHIEGSAEEEKYTFFIYEQLKSLLDSMGSDAELKRKVFCENAEKVYAVMQSENTNGKRVTLKDVAEKSGYSLRTVKKVIGGREYVSDSVKAKVLAASRDLQYKRNKFASALAKNQTYKIAVVYTETSKYFFPEIRAGFENCSKAYEDFGIEVEYYVSKGTKHDISNIQLGILQELHLRSDIDGILIHPFSSKKLIGEIDSLVEAGKPVITFGTDVPDSKRLCYVGPHGRKSGRIAAQIMGNYLGGKGRVVVLGIVSDHRQTLYREEGFLEKMHEAFPSIEIIRPKIDGLLTDDECYAFVKGLIVEETVAGIFSPSANVYLAASALKEMERKDIAVVGYDLSDETKALLKEDYIKVVMFQNPQLQAHKSLQIMCEFLLEGTKPETDCMFTEVLILTGECV